MPLRPVRDRILVKRAVAEEKSPGGIIIPDDVKEAPTRGVVVAVGPGAPASNDGWQLTGSGVIQGEAVVYTWPYAPALLPMPCAVNDTILFGKYAGVEVKDGTETYVLIGAEDVLAVVT